VAREGGRLGQLYLEYEPATPPDRLLVEDLAVTMLINSRVAAQAATSVCRHGASLDLGSLPDKTLEATTGSERQAVAEVLGMMASWPWLGNGRFGEHAQHELRVPHRGRYRPGERRTDCRPQDVLTTLERLLFRLG